MIIEVATHEAAQRQFWRHVANRACLAILADARVPLIRVGAAQGTKPPQTVKNVVGAEVYVVKAESIEIKIDNLTNKTQPIEIEVAINTNILSRGSIMTLDTIKMWSTPKTPEILFKYWSTRKQLVRREGLSGDVIYLFEELLRPHAKEILNALSLDVYQHRIVNLI